MITVKQNSGTIVSRQAWGRISARQVSGAIRIGVSSEVVPVETFEYDFSKEKNSMYVVLAF